MGNVEVSVKVNNSQGNEIKDKFNINVVDEAKKVETVKLLDKNDNTTVKTITVLRNADGSVKSTAYGKVELPAKYKTGGLVAKAYDANGTEIDSTAQIKAKTIRVDWTEGVNNCYKACEGCGGTGAKPGTSPETCSVCGGRGQVEQVQRTLFGQFVSVRSSLT